jgi:hypothetical protein
MNTRVLAQTKPSTASAPPIRSKLLQRKCACGGTPRPTGECEECRRKREAVILQRKVAQPSTLNDQHSEVPPIVHEVLQSSGQPLDPATRAFMELRFNHDFSHVRVHTDAKAAESARAVNALAYTVRRDVVFGANQYAPQTREGQRLLAHELTHVGQQQHAPLANLQIAPAHGVLEDEANSIAKSSLANTARVRGALGSSSLQRQSAPPATKEEKKPPPPANPLRLELEVVGADATLDEPLAVMAARWAHDHGGRVLRVSSLEDMIGQIEVLADARTCLGNLVVWYHGSPEIQLIVGEYQLPPANRRLPASGFTREWLQLERNQAALNRFRHLFCCGASMQWMGCGTATVRASGGLRTQQELERAPAVQEHPDIYQSAQEAQQHGAKLTGASFGKLNVQAWANATCTTIRSATNLVTLRPESRNPITIDNGGVWTDVKPAGTCPCDPETGRVVGQAPSRKEMVKEWQKETSALVGPKNVLWHELLLTLRTGIPHATEVIGSGTQGERTFQAQPGTLPKALIDEMQHRKGGKRGPLERQYVQVLFELLQIAAEGVVPPAPLPNIPMPNNPFLRIAVGGNWAAVTQRHLAVVNRSDFWHWIVFNDQAIGETPEFTRTVIQHELEHAADYEKDLQDFEKTHPRPTTSPPPEFGRPAEETAVRSFSGAWGKYINEFIEFQKLRTRPERHLEIILEQRRQTAPGGGSSWDRWSAGERAYWFQLVFHNLPPDIKAGSPVAGETEVLNAFRLADPNLQLAAVERAYDTIKAAMCPAKNANLSDIAAARANARTLIQHFNPIIERVLREKMRDTPRGTVLSLLQRRPDEPPGMECQL